MIFFNNSLLKKTKFDYRDSTKDATDKLVIKNKLTLDLTIQYTNFTDQLYYILYYILILCFYKFYSISFCNIFILLNLLLRICCHVFKLHLVLLVQRWIMHLYLYIPAWQSHKTGTLSLTEHHHGAVKHVVVADMKRIQDALETLHSDTSHSQDAGCYGGHLEEGNQLAQKVACKVK